MKGGFKESPLRLNEGLRELDQWHENAIRDRAKRLANKSDNRMEMVHRLARIPSAHTFLAQKWERMPTRLKTIVT